MPLTSMEVELLATRHRPDRDRETHQAILISMTIRIPTTLRRSRQETCLHATTLNCRDTVDRSQPLRPRIAPRVSRGTSYAVSLPRKLTPHDPDPHPRPKNLTATSTPTSITLTWDAPGDPTVTGYEILRKKLGERAIYRATATPAYQSRPAISSARRPHDGI